MGRAGAGGAAPAPATVGDRFSFVIDQRTTVATRSTPGVRLPAPWQVRLQHAAGSLDVAVTQARRRNLWLSFGILSVLVAGVGLIMVNARRSERLAQQQMDFVATVSHELRTPLAVIRSAAQNLSAGVVPDPQQARKYGDLIETEGRRLTDMVEQVLVYAGLSDDRRPIAARPVEIGGLVRDVLASCTPLFDTEGFRVAVEIEGHVPLVMADEDAIRRAVSNLVNNAIKYGADGRWLGLVVESAVERGQPFVQIRVSDKGRGIEPADLPHVFEAFYRGRHAIEQQIHGNGLGLSLVKRIAETHGGRVSVTSTIGEGTTFTLRLPAMPGDPVADVVGAPAAGGRLA
jgi:signal transduction histidine kinase